jgi:predicted enzyme related to lactoylglutathione lyase
MFLGLRTVSYHTPDLEKGKKWYSELLGFEPYFAEPFYVGFNVGGYELGLLPDSEFGAPGVGGATPFWGVPNAEAAYRKLLEHGAKPQCPVKDVGSGIMIASVFDPFGNVIGIIENPHFKLPD